MVSCLQESTEQQAQQQQPPARTMVMINKDGSRVTLQVRDAGRASIMCWSSRTLLNIQTQESTMRIGFFSSTSTVHFSLCSSLWIVSGVCNGENMGFVVTGGEQASSALQRRRDARVSEQHRLRRGAGARRAQDRHQVSRVLPQNPSYVDLLAISTTVAISQNSRILNVSSGPRRGL